VVYRTNRRRHVRRRRNKGNGEEKAGMLAPIQRMLKGIPIVGPVLAGAIGVIPTAAIGAVSVEPTMWLASLIGPMLPAGLGSSWLYAGAGLLFAGVTKAWGPNLIGKRWANDLAVAAAAAGGAVAYYKMRTGTDVDVETEVGMLELHGVGLGSLGMLTVQPGYAGMFGQPNPAVYSDGMAYAVQPFPGNNMGALIIGAQ
jgi:hypothetical protein